MTAAQNHRDAPTPNGAPIGQDAGFWPAPARLAAPRSRAGGLWMAAVVCTLVLLPFLIFVLENSQRVDVSFLSVRGHLPVGAALLLAAVFGVLLVALPGTARILQLRMLAQRSRPRGAATPLTAPFTSSLDDPADQQAPADAPIAAGRHPTESDQPILRSSQLRRLTATPSHRNG